MAEMKHVSALYSYESTEVIVKKEKRDDYKNGGSKREVTMVAITTLSIFVRLECGHVREQKADENFQGAKRLGCFYCAIHPKTNKGPDTWSTNLAALNLMQAKSHLKTLKPL